MDGVFDACAAYSRGCSGEVRLDGLVVGHMGCCPFNSCGRRPILNLHMVEPDDTTNAKDAASHRSDSLQHYFNTSEA